MTLRFVPLFTSRLKEVAVSQKCMGGFSSGKSIIKRAKNGMKILSVV